MAPITARGRSSGRHRQRGFGMLWALVSVALIGIYLMKVGEVWSTQAQRIKEDELLRRGDAIRAGIEAYVKADKSAAFPKELKDLLRDSRTSFVQRYLRQPYDDPMTNGEWQTIRGADGELYGVYSASAEAPLKKDGFSDSDASFATQTSYSDWKFAYYPDKSLRRR